MTRRPNLFLPEGFPSGPRLCMRPEMAAVCGGWIRVYTFALSRCPHQDRPRFRDMANLYHPHVGMFAYLGQVEHLFTVVAREDP